MRNKIATNKNCLYCGTNMRGMSQLRTRRYCSKSCGDKYKLRQKKPDVQSKLWVHEPAVFEEAMEMYWDGTGGAEIARSFEIPDGTVYSWIHDFGKQRERSEPKKSLKDRFRTAKCISEWYGILRESTSLSDESYGDMPVCLVCGTMSGQSVNRFASVVSEGLKENPLSGKSYAFCSKSRNTISVFSWKFPVFSISKYIKMHGTFIWPEENLGCKIEITKAEFGCLLMLGKCRKSTGIISESLDIAREL